jgi:alpha-glucosidase
VPLPWEAASPSYGFGPSAESWLPQPEEWAGLARDAQAGVAGSTLELYTLALRLRREHALGLGSVQWLPGHADEIVAFTNGAVTVVANTGAASVPLPAGELLLASGPLPGNTLPGDTTVWLRA